MLRTERVRWELGALQCFFWCAAVLDNSSALNLQEATANHSAQTSVSGVGAMEVGPEAAVFSRTRPQVALFDAESPRHAETRQLSC